MDRVRFLCAVIILCCTLSGCGSLNNVSSVAANTQKETAGGDSIWSVNGVKTKEYYELTEMTEMCAFIIKGSCEEQLSDEGGVLIYSVLVEKQFQGSVLPTVIPVDTVGRRLSKGESYYFFLDGVDSVYTETIKYLSEDILYIDKEQFVCSDLIRDCTAIDAAKWEEALKNAIASRPFSGKSEYSGYYLHSDDLNEISEYAEYIVILEPVSFINLGSVSDRENYQCKVLSALKGQTEETIRVVFKPGTVRTGEQYTAMLIKHENSSIYALAAPTSVFLESSPEAEQIRKLIENK